MAVSGAKQCNNAPPFQVERRIELFVIEAKPAQAEKRSYQYHTNGIAKRHLYIMLELPHFQVPPVFFSQQIQTIRAAPSARSSDNAAHSRKRSAPRHPLSLKRPSCGYYAHTTI